MQSPAGPASKECAAAKETEEVERERDEERAASRCEWKSLPPEVLEMIFRMLPYKEIAASLRLVSRKCASVATSILNAALLSSRPRLRSVQRRLEARALGCSDALDRSTLARARNYLEYADAQLGLLWSAVARYTHPFGGRHPKYGRLCFYGGALLDELDSLLRVAVRCPAVLLERDGPAGCILDFAVRCKKFMNYFEKVSEKKINKNSLISGCKPIDILDCLLEGRELLELRVPSPRDAELPTATVGMKLRYVMARSWFTCLDLPESESREDEKSWRDQQRFMYLRLRRLVSSFNEHRLEKRHYEMEMLMSVRHSLPIPKVPTCSTYTGYGEYAGKFYYYGHMNESAFEGKVLDTWRRTSSRERTRKKEPEDRPSYDLVIDVELRCSPELAPLSLRSMLKYDDFDHPTCASSRPEFCLSLSIDCPAAFYNRLPNRYVWELNTSHYQKP
ncbi:uncharacterized protein LOC131666333 [Phymastichus coffea]|uniref:uncharacterized protein LOC131666333 n=1 Tax=Phymastichus coffea TaxID=108790 RepID=UPI00273C6A1E|nr:uncharacterized protein LOC131666333 [Phymastichus coffea]